MGDFGLGMGANPFATAIDEQGSLGHGSLHWEFGALFSTEWSREMRARQSDRIVARRMAEMRPGVSSRLVSDFYM